MAEATTKYLVLSPILMGGKTYAIGASIALTAEQVEALRSTGAIDVSGAFIAARVDEVLPLAGPRLDELAVDRHALIRGAVAKLDHANKSHFTRDGKPQIAAVEAAVGFDTTRAEIDAAVVLPLPPAHRD